MQMSEHVAQMRISRELREAELAVDAALLKQSALLSTLIQTRQDTGSSPFLGHDALLRLTRSQTTLLSAGGELARVHSSLLKIQHDVLGYEACPDNVPMRTAQLDNRAAA